VRRPRDTQAEPAHLCRFRNAPLSHAPFALEPDALDTDQPFSTRPIHPYGMRLLGRLSLSSKPRVFHKEARMQEPPRESRIERDDRARPCRTTTHSRFAPAPTVRSRLGSESESRLRAVPAKSRVQETCVRRKDHEKGKRHDRAEQESRDA
jgi:hypothetical protein